MKAFFVHPQIKLNKENLKKVFFSFFKSPNFSFLERRFSFCFSGKQFVFTDMARSSFKLIIEKLNLKNSQIIVPAYICDIFFPILKKYNIKPIFVDIELNTFNINIDEVRKKVSPEAPHQNKFDTGQAKAILVSHTYGLPFDINKIKEIFINFQSLTLNPPFIIEDCAHSFGAPYQSLQDGTGQVKYPQTYTGNLGDVSFFSIYKQFPTLRGGFLVCPKDWDIKLPKTTFGFRDFISFLNSFCFFAFLFKIFGQNIAPKMVRREKMSEPAALNQISLNFFSYFSEGFEETLKKRIELALFFQEELKKIGFEVQESKNNVFCYLSALVPKNIEEKRDRLVRELRKNNVFCTRIWHTPIILNKEVQKEYEINLAEFPNTVEAAKRIINFPLQNYYEKDDIKRIIHLIKKVLVRL